MSRLRSQSYTLAIVARILVATVDSIQMWRRDRYVSERAYFSASSRALSYREASCQLRNLVSRCVRSYGFNYAEIYSLRILLSRNGNVYTKPRTCHYGRWINSCSERASHPGSYFQAIPEIGPAPTVFASPFRTSFGPTMTLAASNTPSAWKEHSASYPSGTCGSSMVTR